MGYYLQAVLGRGDRLQPHAAAFHNAHIIPLAQGIAMIPLTDDLHEEIGGDGERDFFNKFSAELEAWMQRVSLDTPVAYVECEYFGGVGGQSSVVWAAGTCVLGPVHADNAINQAVELLRVSAALGEGDEFDALGLGKHRDTESWLKDSEK